MNGEEIFKLFAYSNSCCNRNWWPFIFFRFTHQGTEERKKTITICSQKGKPPPPEKKKKTSSPKKKI